MSSVKEELIKTGNLIREKYRALKRGRQFMEEERTENLKPIIEPLKQLVDKTQEIVNVRSQEETPQQLAITSEPRRFLYVGPIAHKYLTLYLDKSDITDRTFGIQSVGKKLKIGNKFIEIKGDDIVIGDDVFTGTPGLWELLALKKPSKDNFTSEDLDVYKEILLKTSGHLKGYNPNEGLSASRSHKYKQIIKPLFNISGEGLNIANDNKIDQKYWDDPNELVERLRLLHYSQIAGNTGVSNEINSIIEELLEAKIIFHK